MTERTERRTVTAERDVVVGWNCDRCAADIPPEYTPSDGSDAHNPYDALPVSFSGYYGGYFDCRGAGPRWLLCKACADALLEAFPFFKDALGKFIRADLGLPHVLEEEQDG